MIFNTHYELMHIFAKSPKYLWYLRYLVKVEIVIFYEYVCLLHTQVSYFSELNAGYRFWLNVTDLSVLLTFAHLIVLLPPLGPERSLSNTIARIWAAALLDENVSLPAFRNNREINNNYYKGTIIICVYEYSIYDFRMQILFIYVQIKFI